MFFLLGIDDTDSTDSKDTPSLALELGQLLESRELARMVNISCHQLMAHPSIAYTTENVCSCLMLDAEPAREREIDLLCREFLLHHCAPHSNPGYVLASWNQFDREIVVWGKTAKISFLNRLDAIALARRNGLSMAGILGSGAGVIGALAAIGLRYEGNDGWISWMPGLTGLQGIYTQAQLSQFIHFDRIESDRQKRPALDDRIQVPGSVRPALRDGKPVLCVSAAKRGSEFEWQA